MSVVYQSQELNGTGRILALDNTPLKNVYVRGLVIVTMPSFAPTQSTPPSYNYNPGPQVGGSTFDLNILDRDEIVFDMTFITRPSDYLAYYEGAVATWEDGICYTVSDINYLNLPDPGMYFPENIDINIVNQTFGYPPKISVFYTQL